MSFKYPSEKIKSLLWDEKQNKRKITKLELLSEFSIAMCFAKINIFGISRNENVNQGFYETKLLFKRISYGQFGRGI